MQSIKNDQKCPDGKKDSSNAIYVYADPWICSRIPDMKVGARLCSI